MNLEKSELESNQDFDFVGYQFRLQVWSVPTDPGLGTEPSRDC